MKKPTEEIITDHYKITRLSAALQLYWLDNRVYPTTEQGLQSLIELPTKEPVPKNWHQSGYMKSLPKDKWGRSFRYKLTEDNTWFEVYSLGEDDLPGGAGSDTDISSLENDYK